MLPSLLALCRAAACPTPRLPLAVASSSPALGRPPWPQPPLPPARGGGGAPGLQLPAMAALVARLCRAVARPAPRLPPVAAASSLAPRRPPWPQPPEPPAQEGGGGGRAATRPTAPRHRHPRCSSTFSSSTPTDRGLLLANARKASMAATTAATCSGDEGAPPSL
ncbi:hypothetical protein SEVIR_5G447750v4 [Setaria viridis]